MRPYWLDIQALNAVNVAIIISLEVMSAEHIYLASQDAAAVRVSRVVQLGGLRPRLELQVIAFDTALSFAIELASTHVDVFVGDGDEAWRYSLAHRVTLRLRLDLATQKIPVLSNVARPLIYAFSEAV